MNKLVFALLALILLFIAGCASTGGASAGASNGGGLPEIAAYDDPEIPALDAAPTE